MMSAENNEAEAVAAADEVCASCGIAAVDNITLKKCACGLVKYCTIDCQKNHRPQHNKLCRKRLAEIRDRDLFEQPDESHLGECPICCLPLPIDSKKSFLMSCCSKRICRGCDYANQKREMEAGLQQRCAFCREPLAESKEEAVKRRMKRIKENNDPVAIRNMAMMRLNEGDNASALEYLTKAAGLGDVNAHYNLSIMYYKGDGVEKDMKKHIYHLEEAAIGGHPEARYNLGILEANIGRHEGAKKHYIIAANLGYDGSLEALRQLYADGHASKEEYSSALRAYQTAVDATKSKEREKAEEAVQSGKVTLKNGEVSYSFSHGS
jgi:tetratricopeptide (TPR) repeat protein